MKPELRLIVLELRANSEKIPTKQAFNKHDGMKRHFKHNGSTKP